MLWERTDPQERLRDRFGFSDAAAASAWLTTTLADRWGIDVQACSRIVLSDTNALAWLATSEGALVAKWSVDPARFPRLEALADVLAALARGGAPVSALLPARDARRQLEVDGVSLGLQRELPGEILDVGDPRQVHAAGASLAHLHRALAELPDEIAEVPALAPPEVPPSLSGRVLTWLEADRSYLPESALRTVRDQMPEDAGDRARQLLHGDFRSTNVLWHHGRIAGILDLDEARRDHRIDELARSAVLLGTRFTEWEPVTPTIRATFLRGYTEVSALDADEHRWWAVLVLWYSLAMVPRDAPESSWARAAREELAAELVEARRLTVLATDRYNASFGQAPALREALLREVISHAGGGAHFEPTFRCEFGDGISVGEGFFANFDCVMLDGGGITIGDRVLLGPRVGLYTSNHALDPAERAAGACVASPIVIGDDVWGGRGRHREPRGEHRRRGRHRLRERRDPRRPGAHARGRRPGPAAP